MRMLFENFNEESKLMVYWLDQLLSHSTVEAIFNDCGVLLSPEFIPTGFHVSQQAAILAQKFISCYSNTADVIQINGVKYVVAVAKDCQLS